MVLKHVSLYVYSETCNERPLWQETTLESNMTLYFYTYVPQLKDHLSYKDHFLWGDLSSKISLYREFYIHVEILF